MGNSGSKQDGDFDIVDYCSNESDIKFTENETLLYDQKRNISSWFPIAGNVKGIVFISHGLNEHSLSYHRLAKLLVRAGYGVYGIDHVSHGNSSGAVNRTTLIPDYQIMIRDFVLFCNERRKLYETVPAFIFAHSMGTLVAMAALSQIQDIRAIIFSGTALFPGPSGSSPFGLRCLYCLSQTSFATCLLSVNSTIAPLGLAAPIFEDSITSDQEMLKLLAKDKRRNKPIVVNKTGFEILKLTAVAFQSIPNITIPVYCVHGGDDTLTLKKGSEYIYANVGTDLTQRKLEIVNGSRHEIINEIDTISIDAMHKMIQFYDMYCDEVNSSQIVIDVPPI